MSITIIDQNNTENLYFYECLNNIYNLVMTTRDNKRKQELFNFNIQQLFKLPTRFKGFNLGFFIDYIETYKHERVYNKDRQLLIYLLNNSNLLKKIDHFYMLAK